MPPIFIDAGTADLFRDEYVDFHLAPDALAPAPHGEAWSRTYDFDPNDPTSTAGGSLLPSTFGLVGPVEQGELADRADVLSFSTAVLDNCRP